MCTLKAQPTVRHQQLKVLIANLAVIEEIPQTESKINPIVAAELIDGAAFRSDCAACWLHFSVISGIKSYNIKWRIKISIKFVHECWRWPSSNQ